VRVSNARFTCEPVGILCTRGMIHGANAGLGKGGAVTDSGPGAHPPEVPGGEPPDPTFPTWFTAVAAFMAGMAMVGGGGGLGAHPRITPRPEEIRPRRDISPARDWLEAIAVWGSIVLVLVGGRIWAGSWLAAAEIEGVVLLVLGGLVTICVVFVFAVRVIRSGRSS
jgi:hypothetical protein